MIDNNFVDTVIQLPKELFFGTSIATCILVLKKNKSENNISIIRDCGYDIEIQAKKMQDYFINF